MALEELAFDHSIFNGARTAADDKLYARFFMEVMPVGVENGIKKFADIEMVTIMQPGNKLSIVTRVAREEDKKRFAKAYEAFKKNIEDPLDGTPLKEWTGVTSPALIEELKHMGFRTIESIAKASDAACANYAGLRMLKQRAERWVQIQQEQAPALALEQALAERDSQLEALQNQMKEMATKMAELQKK